MQNNKIEGKLDATSQSDISGTVKHIESTLQGRGLDVLTNNASILPFTPDDAQAMTDLDKVLHTGVHMVTSAFLSLLREGREKKVVNMQVRTSSFHICSRRIYEQMLSVQL
jgi:NAD(P)-dependent dehydrogenase (short-subunit alcohol dehydrogenase family)